jgi:hypothetical protein
MADFPDGYDYDDDAEGDEAAERREMLAGRTPAQVREQMLREQVLPWARAHFAKFPEVRSILIGVSQYWADEANDAVHESEVFSPEETPHWPHRCYSGYGDDGPRPAGYEDRCSGCGARDEYITGWNDNWDAIPAFEMFCHELGTQDEDDNYNAMPYAVLRRAPDGDIDVEIVGRVLRGWLERANSWVTPVMRDERLAALYGAVYEQLDDDGPRHVLADELQQRGEPLGEYLALALHPSPTRAMRARAEALLATWRRSWMGPLLRMVPEGACQFARGFPSRVAAHYDELAFNESWTAEEWRTVEALHLLPGCFSGGLPIAPGLRELGPLNSEQLKELEERPLEHLRRLELALEGEGDEPIARLERAELPSLRELVLSVVRPPEPLLARLSRASQALETIEVRTREAPLITAWLEARGRPRRLAFSDVAHGWPSGFRLTHDAAEGAQLRVELLALDREADAAALGGLIAQLPARLVGTVLLQRSRWWTPLPHEVELLRRLTQRPINVV